MSTVHGREHGHLVKYVPVDDVFHQRPDDDAADHCKQPDREVMDAAAPAGDDYGRSDYCSVYGEIGIISSLAQAHPLSLFCKALKPDTGRTSSFGRQDTAGSTRSVQVYP